MAKKSNAKAKTKNQIEVMQPEFEEDCCDFDFADHDHNSMDMAALIEAHNYQSSLAFELTKLIVTSAPDGNKTEESILNSFVRALKVVSENSPLKDIWES